MQETWFRSLGWEDPLEEVMATHSSILPGEFHGQRSLVDCSPLGPQRVWHDCVTKHSTCVEQVTNKNLLYSVVGNSVQYSVMTYVGKEA